MEYEYNKKKFNNEDIIEELPREVSFKEKKKIKELPMEEIAININMLFQDYIYDESIQLCEKLRIETLLEYIYYVYHKY